MSRWAWSSRDMVEFCNIIDIAWLRRNGYLSGFKVGGIEWKSGFGGKSSVGIEVSVDQQNPWGSYLRLIYTYSHWWTGKKTDLDYKVPLVTTPCNYGGVRYWLICPLVVNGRSCNRRVAKLYMPPGNQYFACRHCHNLTYRSQKEHDKRVSALLKNPAMLEEMTKNIKSLNIKNLMLLSKASLKPKGRS